MGEDDAFCVTSMVDNGREIIAGEVIGSEEVAVVDGRG
jgi:hypothetical protein